MVGGCNFWGFQLANLDKYLAAYFVQHAVLSYERHYAGLQGIEQASQAQSPCEKTGHAVQGKECSNMITLLSELYNFQVISSVLIFDIIRDLLDNDLTEFSIELLLKIVRSMHFFYLSFPFDLTIWFQILGNNFDRMIHQY